MVKVKRTYKAIAYLTFVLLLLANCRPRAASMMAQSESGGVLVRAMTSEPATLDPQGAPSSGLSLVMPYLYDTLVIRDRDNQIHPLLAQSWETAEDGTTVTMVIREGLIFHDGTVLDAAAVKATFDRFKEHGTSSPIYAGIEEIEAVEVLDAHIVRFRFAAPTAVFWSTITMPYAGIVSPASITDVETGEGEYLIGSGSFRLASWERGQRITLERNADYAWGPPIYENQGAPHLAALVFEVIPDTNTQLAALQTGEVDVLFVNQPEHLAELAGHPAIELEEIVLNSLVYLGYNNQKPPLADVAVRHALTRAINQDEIVELALGGLGEPAFSPLPPTLEGFDASLEAEAPAYDPAQAQALLSEAGFEQTADGTWQREGEVLALELLTSTRPPNANIAAILQSQFKAIGVPVTIQQLDGKAVMEATSSGAFDLLLWRYDWNDPDALRVFFSSARIGSTNRILYSNSAFDAWVDRGAQELDPTTRRAIYREAQQLMLQDAPMVPLYVPIDILALRSRIAGAEIGYMGRLNLNDAQLER
jgi:peptide/nickel transport system substrate-binding protein